MNEGTESALERNRVWVPELGRYMTRAKFEYQQRIDAERASATVCKSCSTYAVGGGFCRSCGLDQTSKDFIRWE